jgi:hypothetical protein
MASAFSDIGLSDLGNDIAEVFQSASSGRLVLKTSAVDDVLKEQKAVGPGELNNILKALVDNAAGLATEIGVIFAGTWKPEPGVLGVMFDTSNPDSGLSDINEKPREGCAVFIEAIRTFCDDNGLTDSDRYLRRTSIHELGHCFNLGHDGGNGSFMSTTSANLASTAFSQFIADDRAFLRSADDLDIIPGVVDLGFGSQEFDNPRTPKIKSRKRLELAASVPRRELVPGEPVILDVELRVGRKFRTTYAVPNELDPGFDRMRVFVERPDGQCLNINNRFHFCGSGDVYRIGPGKPLKNNVNLFSQSGQPIFNQPGYYSIYCEFCLDRADGRQEVIASDPVELNVISWDRCAKLGLDATARFLRQPAVSRFVQLRGEVTWPRVGRAVQTFLDDHYSAKTAPYLTVTQYVLARAERARARQGIKSNRKRRDRMIRQFELASQSEHLSINSRATAQRLLQELER